MIYTMEEAFKSQPASRVFCSRGFLSLPVFGAQAARITLGGFLSEDKNGSFLLS